MGEGRARPHSEVHPWTVRLPAAFSDLVLSPRTPKFTAPRLGVRLAVAAEPSSHVLDQSDFIARRFGEFISDAAHADVEEQLTTTWWRAGLRVENLRRRGTVQAGYLHATAILSRLL